MVFVLAMFLITRSEVNRKVLGSLGFLNPGQKKIFAMLANTLLD